MTSTTRLNLPLIDASQAQKNVTHNEAILALDQLVQASVISQTFGAPPASSNDGDSYIVGPAATGAWIGKTGQIAAWQQGVWNFYPPDVGWLVWVVAQSRIFVWSGTAWVDAFGVLVQTLQGVQLFGLGTTATTSNPFSAKLNALLVTAQALSEGGTGDMRMVLNKSATANTVSHLYQDNYSGRAEIGLCGDDNLHIKVSPDGSAWIQAVTIAPSGLATLQQLALASALPVASGGTGVTTATGSGSAVLANAPTLTTPNLGTPSAINLANATNLPNAALGAGAAAANLGFTPARSGANGDITSLSALTQATGFKNRLRNPSFAINQRAVSGTVTLSAGQYGHDGVKAGSAGCTYTFNTPSGLDTTIAISAGSLILPIETGLIEGGNYVLSWGGSAQARVWQGTGASGSGGYAGTPLLPSGLTANAQTNIEFSTGSIRTVQFEPGTVATTYERRPPGIELLLCQRYFNRLINGLPQYVSLTMGAAFNSTSITAILPYLPMRATPSVSISAGSLIVGGPGGSLSSVSFSPTVQALVINITGSGFSSWAPYLVESGSATALNIDLSAEI